MKNISEIKAGDVIWGRVVARDPFISRKHWHVQLKCEKGHLAVIEYGRMANGVQRCRGCMKARGSNYSS